MAEGGGWPGGRPPGRGRSRRSMQGGWARMTPSTPACPSGSGCPPTGSGASGPSGAWACLFPEPLLDACTLVACLVPHLCCECHPRNGVKQCMHEKTRAACCDAPGMRRWRWWRGCRQTPSTRPAPSRPWTPSCTTCSRQAPASFEGQHCVCALSLWPPCQPPSTGCHVYLPPPPAWGFAAIPNNALPDAPAAVSGTGWGEVCHDY